MTEDSLTEPLDPVDVVRGLAHMDVLRERINLARRERIERSTRSRPRSARERHWIDAGHELTQGCCRPTLVTSDGQTAVRDMHRRGD